MHTKSDLIYEAVCSTKYKKSLIDNEVKNIILESCKYIENNYSIKFIDIKVFDKYVKFTFRSIPSYSVSKCMNLIKGIIARNVSSYYFWSRGYYIRSIEV